MFFSCTRIGIPAERIIGSRWSIPVNAIKVNGETTSGATIAKRESGRGIYYTYRICVMHRGMITERTEYFRVYWYLRRSTCNASFTVVVHQNIKIILIAILLTSRTKKNLEWPRKINIISYKKFVYLFEVIMTHKKSWLEIRYQY